MVKLRPKQPETAQKGLTEFCAFLRCGQGEFRGVLDAFWTFSRFPNESGIRVNCLLPISNCLPPKCGPADVGIRRAIGNGQVGSRLEMGTGRPERSRETNVREPERRLG